MRLVTTISANFRRTLSQHNLQQLRKRLTRNAAIGVLPALLALGGLPQHAAADDGEIRIGNTMPYSCPASAYGIIGKTISAYFDKVNAEGGINGRKIKWISYDDSYSPAKTVELTHKLVEQDGVLLIFS